MLTGVVRVPFRFAVVALYRIFQALHDGFFILSDAFSFLHAG